MPSRLPLNDDKEEKSVRFKSRQALHEIQMNSLKAAVATPRKRQSLSQTASPHTPLGDDKENADRLDAVAGHAVTPMKRVPILANFEEWMKMATDNVRTTTRCVVGLLLTLFRKSTPITHGTLL